MRGAWTHWHRAYFPRLLSKSRTAPCRSKRLRGVRRLPFSLSFFRLQHDRQPELHRVNRIHSRNSPVSPMRAAQRARRTTLSAYSAAASALLRPLSRAPYSTLSSTSPSTFVSVSLSSRPIRVSNRWWELQKRGPSYSGSLRRHAAPRVPLPKAQGCFSSRTSGSLLSITFIVHPSLSPGLGR